MRILLIDVNCKNSSTGKIVYDLYTQCNNDGYEAAICYGRGRLVDEQNIYKFSSAFEVYFHALMTRITGLTGYYSFFSTRRLINYIENFKPDVVHIHELHAYFVNILPVINYLKKNNIKTIWTFHCEFMYTGKCGYAYECKKWKTECDQCPNLKDYPSSLFLDFTRKMFNDKKKAFNGFDNLTIVTPSQWLADRVRQSFLGDKRIEVIHNGIDTENIFYPRPFDHLKKRHNLTDEKVILAVAPDLMSERKGGRYVLELAKTMKNENVKFILIGVENLSEQFDDNVIALGRTENQDELAEYYSMADVFVICSLRENFPTTCIEALACGTPVCGFDEGGTKETAPNNLGRFVKFGDVDALKGEVISILNQDISSEECANYGQNEYSKRNMYNKYSDIYFFNGKKRETL
jgi:putative colanic acid biosynthesis glycosyltransferase